MKNLRCAYTHCDGWSGRDPPMSGSVAFLALNNYVDMEMAEGNQIINSGYYELCNEKKYALVMDKNNGQGFSGGVDVKKLDSFTLRDEVQVDLPTDVCTDLRKSPDVMATTETRADGKDYVSWPNGYDAEINNRWVGPSTGSTKHLGKTSSH